MTPLSDLILIGLVSSPSPGGIILNDFHSAALADANDRSAGWLLVLLLVLVGSGKLMMKSCDCTRKKGRQAADSQNRSNKCQHLSYSSSSSSSSPVVFVVGCKLTFVFPLLPIAISLSLANEKRKEESKEQEALI